MARRRRTRRAEEEAPDSYAERRGAKTRRRKSNEGMWLAIGAVAVLGIVVLFVLAGGSGGEAEKEKATEAFRNLVKAALEDNPHLGVKYLDDRETMVAFRPDSFRNWDKLTPGEQDQQILALFNWDQNLLKGELQVESVRDVEKLIESGRVEWVPSSSWVEIKWDRRPPMMSLEHWIVRVQEINGTWIVTKFEKQE